PGNPAAGRSQPRHLTPHTCFDVENRTLLPLCALASVCLDSASPAPDRVICVCDPCAGVAGRFPVAAERAGPGGTLGALAWLRTASGGPPVRRAVGGQLTGSVETLIGWLEVAEVTGGPKVSTACPGAILRSPSAGTPGNVAAGAKPPPGGLVSTFR